MIPNDTDADNRILKYKRMIRKSAINILAWLENNPSPTEEQLKKLRELKGEINDRIFYYAENIQNWEKHTTTIELPQPVIDQQEYLKAGTDAQQEE